MPIDIIIADDEPHVIRALSFVLQKEGYQIKLADNGADALKLISEYHPRVAFLDMMMPKMTGTEICLKVKQDLDLRNTHIVILTCKGQEYDREVSLAAGADEFMTKPFSPREVVARVKDILNRGT